MTAFIIEVNEVHLEAGLLKLLILSGWEKTFQGTNYVSDAS